jgi:TRAP transporter 4TM/12TM fusion protein
MDLLVDRLKTFYLSALIFLGICWVADLPIRLNIGVVTASYIMLMLGISIAAGFLIRPGFRQNRTNISDLILGLIAIGVWFWSAIHYVDWLTDLAQRGPEKWIPGLIGILLLIEALRRFCGIAITLLTITFILYGFFGYFMSGVFEGAFVNPTRLILYFYADTGGVPGLILSIVCTIVFGFILMGELMKTGGGGQFLTDASLSLMGHYQGGPAKVSIIASSVFGSISGSTVGNVMSTGVVTIPLMKKTGLPGYYAAAVEAIASNGGQLAPPVMGATAFLIAEFLNIPYTRVVGAAILPAIVYYVILFSQVDLMAKDNNLIGLDKSELPRFKDLLRERGLHLLPIVLLIILMFGFGFQPAKSALLCGISSLVIGGLLGSTRFNKKTFNNFINNACETLIPVILIGAAAGIIVGVLNITGLGFNLTLLLTDVGKTMGLLVMLMLTGVIAIILGMGMPTAAVYIVLSVVLAPAVTEMGVPVLAAHFFIFYFGLVSMITPPVAVASFVAAGIAKASIWKTSFTAIKLGIAAYLLPFLFVYNDSLLLEGNWYEITMVFATAIISGLMLSHAFRVGNFSSLARILRTILILLFAFLIGSSTLWLGKSAPMLIPVIIIGFLITLGLRKDFFKVG